MSLHSIDTGEKYYDFALDVGTITGASGKRNHDELFFSFCSFLTPSTIYKVKFKGREVDVNVRK